MIKQSLALVCTSMLFLLCACTSSNTPRADILLEDGWKFSRDDGRNFQEVSYDDSGWQEVSVPHDWAIYGPFDENNDAQVVSISQDFETVATLKTGRTGALPYMGVGWYRTKFDVEDFGEDKSVSLLFDGAMSNARVYINGKEVGYRPYGYVPFHFDITSFLNPNGKDNILAVRLENLSESSRWYPGAGLYRNVHLIVSNKVHIPVWGTHITTPEVSPEEALVKIETRAEGADKVYTEVFDSKGKRVAKSAVLTATEKGFEETLTIPTPSLWSPEEPNLYYARTSVYSDGKKVDEYSTRFGVRTAKLIPDKGFFLNGELRKFRGVCNHHDLGPLGSAVNVSALRKQLSMLKEMGCDAIRTSHNMPAPELVELCDEMGFMMMVEPFDEWDIAKCRNGYHLYFDEWAEKDMLNMLHCFRNSPSVVCWSIGNEVPSQCDTSGYSTAKFLIDICHSEDSTRFVTCGMDQVLCVLRNGFAALLDVPGLNYHDYLYEQAYDILPHKLVLGSETASTISSRGVYKFPIEKSCEVAHTDRQCSSYDVEYCPWSNLPDSDFALAEDKPWTIGQFVWTGFDYLGEPTPYNLMPNHSSMFGIIDLASIPKDRYYLYRSVWRPEVETLHILPHWTWPGREGEITPVYVYTNYPSAELFVNGKSYGVQKKSRETEQNRYRLMWNDVVYERGEVKVVAYDSSGKAVAETSTRTAGEPFRLDVKADRVALSADGKDLSYIEVSVVDKDGNLCPADGRLVEFTVEGKGGTYRAAANGDPTCLDLFHLPKMHLFSGKLTAIVQSTKTGGEFTFTASANGLEGSSIKLSSR